MEKGGDHDVVDGNIPPPEQQNPVLADEGNEKGAQALKPALVPISSNELCNDIQYLLMKQNNLLKNPDDKVFIPEPTFNDVCCELYFKMKEEEEQKKISELSDGVDRHDERRQEEQMQQERLCQQDLRVESCLQDERKISSGEAAQQSPPAEQAALPAQPANLRTTCDLCLKKKIKCDGRKPACSNCERKDAQCVYTMKRKPGRKRKSAGSDDDDDETDQSKNREKERRNALLRRLLNPC